MRFFVLAALLSCGPVACGSGCTSELDFGLAVSVVDSQTGAVLCSAVVTATDGSYSETLKTFAPLPLADGGTQCVFSGAPERAGTYTVDAKAEGRESSATGIVVSKENCHVVPRVITLKL
jgi:hypothetical protein